MPLKESNPPTMLVFALAAVGAAWGGLAIALILLFVWRIF
jgi:hypothetical protein